MSGSRWQAEPEKVKEKAVDAMNAWDIYDMMDDLLMALGAGIAALTNELELGVALVIIGVSMMWTKGEIDFFQIGTGGPKESTPAADWERQSGQMEGTDMEGGDEDGGQEGEPEGDREESQEGGEESDGEEEEAEGQEEG